MNNVLLGLLIVGAFVVWKFILQPIMNEGEPIEPVEGKKTFTEQMEDSFKPSVDF